MENKDCIYYEEKEEDTGMRHCKYSHSLYEEDEDMCACCRLWDAYIPNNSTEQQTSKAVEWQNKPTEEQEDYDDYFKE
jgi:hypothetical protein